MKKRFGFPILLCAFSLICSGQVSWLDTAFHFSSIEWDNYSTSFLGDGSDSVPILIAAIPYNGISQLGSSVLNMTMSGSAYHFQSNMTNGLAPLYTHDSGAVYFLVAGVFRSNAAAYQYRVLQDGQTLIKDWSNITEFTDSSFALNQFKKAMAFLGGYSSHWGHCLGVELRKKGATESPAIAVVCWQPIRPQLLSVLTGRQLNERLLRLGKPYDLSADSAELALWRKQYRPQELDSLTGMPKKMRLQPSVKDLMFFINATITKKEALEYRLNRNGRTIRDWGPNEVANNFIWLQDLGPGDYRLEMRFRKQRHNVTAYPFEILPDWYQGWLARVTALILGGALIGFFFLLARSRRQRARIRSAQEAKEKLALELRSIHAQLNPHFIFNALASIQGLINKGDYDAANRYLSEFGLLMRNSLLASDKTSLPLSRELAAMETYLKLEQLRFHFNYSLEPQKGLPLHELEIPALLWQPLLENAVRHGVAGKEAKGQVRVRLQRENNDLLLYIQDNGPGIGSLTAPSPGYGLRLTRDRIALLNQLGGAGKIELSVTPNEDGGTSILLLFKNWLA